MATAARPMLTAVADVPLPRLSAAALSMLRAPALVFHVDAALAVTSRPRRST